LLRVCPNLSLKNPADTLAEAAEVAFGMAKDPARARAEGIRHQVTFDMIHQ
jgi:hypothetical protein